VPVSIVVSAIAFLRGYTRHLASTLKHDFKKKEKKGSIEEEEGVKERRGQEEEGVKS
jgi:hypothetical protein